MYLVYSSFESLPHCNLAVLELALDFHLDRGQSVISGL